MNDVRYKLNRKILNGKQLVGYEVLDSCGNTRNLAVQDVKQLCKSGILLGVKLDNKTGQLRGNGIDLRTIKSVQMQELEKDQLKRQLSSTNTGDKLRKLDNIVYYETIQTDGGSEKIAYLRAKGYYAIKIDNVQADSLVIYRQDEDETQKYLMLDPLQVKVKHLVIVNIQCDLFGMIENYINTNKKKMTVSAKDQQSFIKMTIDFINRLEQLNYIKDDDYLLEPKIEDVRYFETNANWFNGQNSLNNNEFYFKYRNIVNRLGLSLTKYMNKLYNDHVVRQIMDGTVKLRYLSDKVQTFKSFERQLELEKLGIERQLGLERLGNKKQVKSCKTFRKSLLSYKIDETTIDKVDNGSDALIELDLDVVDRLVKDCKDFDILRKLAIPNMQVVKCYRSQLKGKQARDSSGFSNGIVVEPYKLQEYLTNLADKIRTEKYSKYSQSLSNKEAEKLLIPLENKLRLIDQSNTKLQGIIGEKIVNYLIDIYNRDNSLGYKLPVMLIYLANKYCPKTMDNIGGLSILGGKDLGGLQASWVRQTTCPDYKNSKASGNCDKSVLDIDLGDYAIWYTQLSLMLNRPELSIFITDLYHTFESGSLNKENIFIARFDFSDYNFLNVNTFNSVFTGAEIGEVVLDGLWFSRLKNFTGVFNNAKIDKVIIKNCDLSNARQNYEIFSNFVGKVLILNSRFNPKAKGLVQQFGISFGKAKTCDSLYSSNVCMCTDMYGEQHYIRSKNLHNNEISELYTNSVDIKYFRENKLEIENVVGPNGNYTGEVRLRYLKNFADLCEYGDSASKQKKDYEICRKGKV